MHNIHLRQLFQCFCQRQIQLVKVLANARLLKGFHKEDTGVDATVMRDVQRVLVLLVPDDSILS
jgi:hypothetical protein